MKKKLALLAAPLVLLAASAATAESRWLGITPYLGADAEIRHMDFQKGYGGNNIKHSLPQGNLYAGLRFNEYVAVEAGYEATKRKTTSSTDGAGVVSFGLLIPALTTLQYNTVAQAKAFHANLVGTLPICELYRLDLIGSIGIARLKTKIVRTLVAVDGIPFPVNDPDAVDKFVKRKSILRLGAGLQHMINCNWGLRAMLKWENTNKLKLISQTHPLDLSVKPKNSFIYSLGVFYNF